MRCFCLAFQGASSVTNSFWNIQALGEQGKGQETTLECGLLSDGLACPSHISSQDPVDLHIHALFSAALCVWGEYEGERGW